jgi:hypothetical protein
MYVTPLEGVAQTIVVGDGVKVGTDVPLAAAVGVCVGVLIEGVSVPGTMIACV